MIAKNSLAFFISSGFAVRNFISSGIIEDLKKFYNVTLFVPEIYKNYMSEEILLNNNINYTGIGNFPKGYKILRSIIVKAENKRLGNGDPYFKKWHICISKGKQKLVVLLEYLLSDIAAKTAFYKRLKNLENVFLQNISKKIEFQNYSDIIISTNPFNSMEFPYLYKAKKLNVKTLAIILSWDNLLWMGKVPVESDYYFVWGPQMHKDLKKHFPNYQEERIFEVGCPQFDFHIDEKYLWSKRDFFNYLNLNYEKDKLLCYTANIKEHFYNEPVLIERIAESVRNNKIKGNLTLILRIHPHDNTKRFDYLKEKYPEIIFSKLNEKESKYNTWFIPNKNSLAFYSNLIRYSAMNINLASSTTLDYCFLDKPVINIAFSPVEADPFSLRMPHYYNSPHYKEVVEIGATKIAYSMDELERAINIFLENPKELSDRRKELVEKICGGNERLSKYRIIEGIEYILNEKNTLLH